MQAGRDNEDDKEGVWEIDTMVLSAREPLECLENHRGHGEDVSFLGFTGGASDDDNDGVNAHQSSVDLARDRDVEDSSPMQLHYQTLAC